MSHLVFGSVRKGLPCRDRFDEGAGELALIRVGVGGRTVQRIRRCIDSFLNHTHGRCGLLECFLCPILSMNVGLARGCDIVDQSPCEGIGS